MRSSSSAATDRTLDGATCPCLAIVSVGRLMSSCLASFEDRVRDGYQPSCDGNDDDLMRLSSLFHALCPCFQERVVACGSECCLKEDVS